MTQTVVHELAEHRVGKTLKGKWTLDSILGVGGMATVYAATHRNGSRVAIKMLHATLASSTELCRRFVREAYLVNKVEHPGVVRVIDDDVDDDGSVFLVMDRAPGISLCDRANERLLDETEALEVAEQVLAILVASHTAGVVHRDLKPDNLLVDERGTVHLVDFGIARLLEEDRDWHTRTGFAFGTPGYMAPEQAMGKTEEICERTDLYALGATLFTLMSGEHVHAAETPEELMILIATRPARSLGDVVAGASPDLARLVDRATAFHAESRWSSAAAMLDEVRRIQERRGTVRRPETRRKISSRMDALSRLPPAPSGNRRSTVAETAPREPTRPSLVRLDRKARTSRKWVLALAAALCAAFGIVQIHRRATVHAAPIGEATASEPVARIVPPREPRPIEVASYEVYGPPRPALTPTTSATAPAGKPAPRPQLALKSTSQGLAHQTIAEF